MRPHACAHSSRPRRARFVSIVFLLAIACNSGNGAPTQTAGEPPRSPPTAVEPSKTASSTGQPDVPVARAPTAEPQSFESFDAYWPAFREAIQANDKNKIATLTCFPFETRGPSDDDVVKKLTREQFVTALDSLLSQDPGLLMNGKETQREHIARTKTLTTRQHVSGDGSARVGEFEFQKQGGRWLFTRAYVSDVE